MRSILVDLPSSSPAMCIGYEFLPKDLNKYNTIFLGTVIEPGKEKHKGIKVTKQRKRARRSPSNITKSHKGIISVDKIWKGTPVKEVTFVSIPIYASLLIRGEQLLFYTSLLKGDIMNISMCSPFKKAKDHEVEIMFLDWKFAGHSQKKIINQLTKILLEHEEERFRL